MTALPRWPARDALSLRRALRLRWRTRGGFTVGDVPAFDAETAAWFRERIAQARGYVEFGSGASTVLAARAGVRTISMESDPRYAAAVRAALPPGAPVALLDAAIGLTEEWGYPVATRPARARHARWLNYATRPLAMAEEQGWTPDLVLVDGRFRRACALAAALAAERTGTAVDILFDDYAGRSYYRGVEQHLGSPRPIGRAALFSRVAGAPPSGITDALIAEAAKDFR